MPTNKSGKGNPASKRIGNAKRKERRQRSWTRGERRKAERRRANEARMKANMDALEELGGKRQLYERVIERDGKVTKRMKMESPGSALARVRRESNG